MMLQKKLASEILKCGPGRIVLNPQKLNEIKEAITRFDVKRLINQGLITKKQKQGISKSRSRKTQEQKKKGRRKGQGSRKGTKNARENKKRSWINHVRKQRKLLKYLKEKQIINNENYKLLYYKSKGGFFRSIRHLKIYIKENNLAQQTTWATKHTL